MQLDITVISLHIYEVILSPATITELMEIPSESNGSLD